MGRFDLGTVNVMEDDVGMIVLWLYIWESIYLTTVNIILINLNKADKSYIWLKFFVVIDDKLINFTVMRMECNDVDSSGMLQSITWFFVWSEKVLVVIDIYIETLVIILNTFLHMRRFYI